MIQGTDGADGHLVHLSSFPGWAGGTFSEQDKFHGSEGMRFGKDLDDREQEGRDQVKALSPFCPHSNDPGFAGASKSHLWRYWGGFLRREM